MLGHPKLILTFMTENFLTKPWCDSSPKKFASPKVDVIKPRNEDAVYFRQTSLRLNLLLVNILFFAVIASMPHFFAIFSAEAWTFKRFLPFNNIKDYKPTTNQKFQSDISAAFDNLKCSTKPASRECGFREVFFYFGVPVHVALWNWLIPRVNLEEKFPKRAAGFSARSPIGWTIDWKEFKQGMQFSARVWKCLTSLCHSEYLAD